MSRYVIWTENENLEVFVGYDEGFDGYFLTIADTRICTGESGTYLFHNMDHHAAIKMTLDEVATTLQQFGLALPSSLAQQLETDGNSKMVLSPMDTSSSVRITGWQSAA